MTGLEAGSTPGTSSPDPLVATSHYEALALKSHLHSLFSQLDINCVLDVGANIGYFGQLVRSFGYEGWLCSFEPVEETFRVLNDTAGKDVRWRVFNFALGSREETRTIGVAENSVLSSFLEPSDYQVAELGGMSDITTKQVVPVHTLDSVLDECIEGIGDPRIFLKVDTQGWDLEVLNGGLQTLERVLALQTELSVKPLYEGMPGFFEPMTEISQHGFELTGLFTVIRDRALRVIELDCVMARAS